MASLALNKFLILYGANTNLMSKFLQENWVKLLILCWALLEKFILPNHPFYDSFLSVCSRHGLSIVVNIFLCSRNTTGSDAILNPGFWICRIQTWNWFRLNFSRFERNVAHEQFTTLFLKATWCATDLTGQFSKSRTSAVECSAKPYWDKALYNLLPITRTLPDSNLALTRTKSICPGFSSYIYCNFTLGNSSPRWLEPPGHFLHNFTLDKSNHVCQNVTS